MQLKKEVEDRVHLHKNLEQLYDGKFKNTQAQLDAAVNKNEEYEKMVKFLRKKSAIDKESLVKVCPFLISNRSNITLTDSIDFAPFSR